MTRAWVLLMLLGAVCMLAACGPQGPIVEVQAADVNLTVEDLGPGYILTSEIGLEGILERIHLADKDKGPLQDANRRSLSAVETIVPTTPEGITRTQVVATVLIYDAANSAQAGLTENRDSFVTVTKPTLTLSTLAVSMMGDQVEFWKADIPDRGARLYLLIFRQTNVVGMLTVVGPAGLEENWVLGLGQKMLERIPEAIAR